MPNYPYPYYGELGGPTCTWTQDADGNHIIYMPHYDFSSARDLFGTTRLPLVPGTTNTVKLPTKTGLIDGTTHAPIITDVRHRGARSEQYIECNINGKDVSNPLVGADLFSDRGTYPIPGSGGQTYTLWDDNLNGVDGKGNVYKPKAIPSMEDINPKNPNSEITKDVWLYNYDKSLNSITIAWNTHIIKSEHWETFSDVIAVRARFTINHIPGDNPCSPTKTLWSRWFCAFAPSVDSWDDGPHHLTLYGYCPTADDINRDEGASGFTMGHYHNLGESSYGELQNYYKSGEGHNGCMSIIPPGYPHNIVVQVQVANLYGVGTGSSLYANSLNTIHRSIKDESLDESSASSGNYIYITHDKRSNERNARYCRYPARKIFVKPVLTNATLVNVKPFVDWLKVCFIGPAGTSIDLNPSYSGKHEKPDEDELYTWYGTESTPSAIQNVYEIKVFARPSSSSTLEFQEVYNWKASPKTGIAGNYHKYNGELKDSNPMCEFNTIKTKILDLANQKPSNDNSIADNEIINKNVFKPNTEYTLRIYYTVLLHDSINEWYREYHDINGKKYDGYKWKETPHTITKVVELKYTSAMNLKTLPISELYTNKKTDDGLVNYKYIFGASQVKDGTYGTTGLPKTPMQFRLLRQHRQMVNNEEVYKTPKLLTREIYAQNHPNMSDKDIDKILLGERPWIWDNNYDQVKTMRITFTATKNNTTAKITRTLIVAEETNVADQKAFKRTYGFSYKGITLSIYLSLKEWDSLYKLFPKEGEPNINNLNVNVLLETRSTYKDSEGNYKWYKNSKTETTITVNLTGIEPTSHVNIPGFKRAYIWVKDDGTGGAFKRAVAWVKDDGTGGKFFRSI